MALFGLLVLTLPSQRECLLQNFRRFVKTAQHRVRSAESSQCVDLFFRHPGLMENWLCLCEKFDRLRGFAFAQINIPYISQRDPFASPVLDLSPNRECLIRDRPGLYRIDSD